MSTKELREKAQQTLDSIPDEMLPRFIQVMEEVKGIIKEAEFDARVKRLIEENRGLLQRLAK
jgi:hypothetical protein